MVKSSVLSNITTSESITPTENSITNSEPNTDTNTKSFIGHITSIINHNKFKWGLLFVILLVGFFFYLRMQLKNIKKEEIKFNQPPMEKLDNSTYKLIKDKDGNDVLVNMSMHNPDNIQNDNKIDANTTQSRLHLQPEPVLEQVLEHNPLPVNQLDSLSSETESNGDSEDILRNIEQLDDSESDKQSNFIESDILRAQDLTVAELETINRQLDEANFDKTVMMVN